MVKRSTRSIDSGHTREPKGGLILRSAEPWAARLRTATTLWAEATTRGDDDAADELRQQKEAKVERFFAFVAKPPVAVTSEDVAAWRDELAARGLAATSIYAQLSLLSSFYSWAARNAAPEDAVRANPVRYARPKRPRSYQSEATQSLTNKEVDALLAAVDARAAAGDVAAIRDHALIRWYLVTGMRRSEIIRLRGSDLRIEEDRILVTTRVKGGFYRSREMRDEGARETLLEYLTVTGRLGDLESAKPLWIRHDRAGRGRPLGSHGFVRNLKLYAEEAGLRHIHLHQFRHTYARLVADETGSLLETQEALGHDSPEVTRHYVQRITVRRDKHSATIGAKFPLRRSKRHDS